MLVMVLEERALAARSRAMSLREASSAMAPVSSPSSASFPSRACSPHPKAPVTRMRRSESVQGKRAGRGGQAQLRRTGRIERTK